MISILKQLLVRGRSDLAWLAMRSPLAPLGEDAGAGRLGEASAAAGLVFDG